jgi:hypothetical protein
MSGQLAFASSVTHEEIAREQSLGGAIDLCMKVAGMVPKQLQDTCNFDKGQYSRWIDGQEGIKWDRLVNLMDACGNHAPVLWMLHRLGYDLTSLRRRESEMEREVRLLREELAKVRAEHAAGLRFMAEAMRGSAP